MNANPVIFISNPLIHLAFLNTLLRLANFLSTTQRILKYVYLVYFLFLGIINLDFFLSVVYLSPSVQHCFEGKGLQLLA